VFLPPPPGLLLLLYYQGVWRRGLGLRKEKKKDILLYTKRELSDFLGKRRGEEEKKAIFEDTISLFLDAAPEY